MSQPCRKRKQPGGTPRRAKRTQIIGQPEPVTEDTRQEPETSSGRKQTQIGQPEPNIESWYGPETDLKTGVKCEKNPGHLDFIPVTEFSVHHLDTFLPGETDESKSLVFKYIKAWADLTVHLKASTVSKDRPALWRDTNDLYPSSHARGGNHTRTGSGFFRDVVKCGEGGDDHEGETCPCEGCILSGNPKKTWWEGCMFTARHVIFDQTEVKDASFSFFLDERKRGRSVHIVKSESGGNVNNGQRGSEGNVNNGQSGSEGNDWKALKADFADTLSDHCEFTLITHDDEKVGERLADAWLCVDECSVRSHVKKLLYNHKLTAVIGHPHGCSKHISLGRQVEWVAKLSDGAVYGDSPLIHSASTCPGCSGGAVLGCGMEDWCKYILLDPLSPHSEGLCDGNAKTAGYWLW